MEVLETETWSDLGLDAAEDENDVRTKRGGGKKKLLLSATALMLAGGCILYTLHARQLRAAKGLTAAELSGKWVLSSSALSQFPGVLKQSVQFSGNDVKGTTIIRADSPAGTDHLPFPDHTVDSVVESGDGYKLTAAWHGTFKVLSGGRVDLTIGKADYTLRATLNPKTHGITFSHDLLLVGGAKTLYTSG